MGKKETYFILAEKYYVEEQQPISGIANRLNITEKTLHGWKKEGDWENKKMKFLQSQYSCYASLYELVNKMAVSVNEAYNNGQKPDGSTLYSLTKLIDKLPKLKKFETELITDKNAAAEEKNNGDMSAKIAELIDKRLMGG